MSDELRRLRMQQEATSAAIARMQMQLQAQNARREPDEEEEELPPAAQAAPQYQQQQPQYQGVDPNQLVLQAITNQAANIATQQVQQNLTATEDVQSKVKKRMERLVANYPALTDGNSDLVIESRKIYARIDHENPTWTEDQKYELAVNEAAAMIGARPVSAPVEQYATSDYVMPVGRNPAISSRSSRSRLTPNIITSARLIAPNVNWDPNTVEGKKNLAELSEYSAHFNADQDESQYRYR